MLEADSIGVQCGGRQVLSSASLRARPGQITLLVGRNGAGKSSLLRACVGAGPLLHGIVRFGGTAHHPPQLPRLAREGLFWLPDEPILDPFLRLGRQIEAVAAHFGVPDVTTIRGPLRIESLWNTAPVRLSGGETRRAAVALALARHPRCLVMDEPFRGLSPIDAELLAGVFRQVADRGVAMLLTGHEMPLLQTLADAVVWCTAGTTHQYPDPGTAWDNHELRRDFLGGRPEPPGDRASRSPEDSTGLTQFTPI